MKTQNSEQQWSVLRTSCPLAAMSQGGSRRRRPVSRSRGDGAGAGAGAGTNACASTIHAETLNT